MLPILQVLKDGKEHSIHEIFEVLAKEYSLTQQDLDELLPSGKQTVFTNRIQWASTFLAKASLIKRTRRSYSQITERGKETLKKNLSKIDNDYLLQFEEFVEFRTRRPKNTAPLPNPTPESEIINVKTPEETLEDAYQEIRDDLYEDLLTHIKNCPPSFFERLVVDLLVNMGYGGSRKEAGRAVGQTGDGGIDGIIDEDRLGLDNIYIQAKRWDGVVGRPEIQKFVGALMGKKAKKGVFITTSYFSNDAIGFVSQIDYKIILIDGKRLAELMVDYDIGVTQVMTYKLKRIDSDYFNNQ